MKLFSGSTLKPLSSLADPYTDLRHFACRLIMGFLLLLKCSENHHVSTSLSSNPGSLPSLLQSLLYSEFMPCFPLCRCSLAAAQRDSQNGCPTYGKTYKQEQTIRPGFSLSLVHNHIRALERFLDLQALFCSDRNAVVQSVFNTNRGSF
ncbi:hypothetical protein Salat_2725000, partial [Sesamum alatum]